MAWSDAARTAAAEARRRHAGPHSGGTPNLRVTIRKNNSGEHVVRLHINGQHQSRANYYTNDMKDARDSAAHMLRSVRARGGSHDSFNPPLRGKRNR